MILHTANAASVDDLVLAVWKGKTDEVESILRQGVDVNKAGKPGLTALHLAAGNGHAEIVSLLRDKGADGNQVAKRKSSSDDDGSGFFGALLGAVADAGVVYLENEQKFDQYRAQLRQQQQQQQQAAERQRQQAQQDRQQAAERQRQQIDDFTNQDIQDFHVSIDGDLNVLKICVRDHQCEDGDIVRVTVDGWTIFHGEIDNDWDCIDYPANIDESVYYTYYSHSDGKSYDAHERLSINMYAVNGTGHKGNCSYQDANTGEIRVEGSTVQTQTWQHRGGAGSSASIFLMRQ